MLENYACVYGIGLILRARPVVAWTVVGTDKLPMLGEADKNDRKRRCTIPATPGWFVVTITFTGVLIEEAEDVTLESALPADSFTPFSDTDLRHRIVVQAENAAKALRRRDVKSWMLDFVDALRCRNYQGTVDVVDEYGSAIIELTAGDSNEIGAPTARRTR
jgi:hypothetical protein